MEQEYTIEEMIHNSKALQDAALEEKIRRSTIVDKWPCPICKNGEGPARFSELALPRHLAGFHKMHLDIADELTDRWVSGQISQQTKDA